MFIRQNLRSEFYLVVHINPVFLRKPEEYAQTCLEINIRVVIACLQQFLHELDVLRLVCAEWTGVRQCAGIKDRVLCDFRQSLKEYILGTNPSSVGRLSFP